MGIQTVKVHQFARGGFIWEHDEPSSLSLTCKRLRPLAPKRLTTTTTISGTFDLKSFIRAENGPKKAGFFDNGKKESISQVEMQPGGTRWNPTPEQIGILEMLYRNGMRTPNAQQIEHVTAQLATYGKIEGKNVFYWFQNHKARERQKQKRITLNQSHMSPRTLSSPFSSTTTSLVLSSSNTEDHEVEEGIPFKRKCKTWEFDQSFIEENNSQCTKEEAEVEDRTLKLFPLHPESGKFLCE